MNWLLLIRQRLHKAISEWNKTKLNGENNFKTTQDTDT